MIPHLEHWLRIIEEMKNDNTYKTAWGKGIVECVHLLEPPLNDPVIIQQSDIAWNMIKYYWNQTFFFDLKQGHNPVIVQKVQRMIDKYKREVNTYPVPWNEAKSFFDKQPKYMKRIINQILSNARTNVCPRFLNVSKGERLDIYQIDDDNKTLIFKKEDIQVIKEYAFVLSKLLNYKWAQLLERFNTAPKITNKVQAAAEKKIRRSSLTKYKNLLLEYYHDKEIRDFYTGEVIDKNDIHIDHVIPWSFIYSDDIWNLVVTKSTNNLQKSNRPPTRMDIEKLNQRNMELMEQLSRSHPSHAKQIRFALDNKTIDKLFINMKG